MDKKLIAKFLVSLKEIKIALPFETVLQWLNDNNVKYEHMNDIEMYIYYLENVDPDSAVS